MGYISSGVTDNMVIYLTPKAIEYLMGKKNSPTDLSIKYFSLGDSDTNYLIDNRQTKGNIIDLSGEDVTCLKNVGVDFNNKSLYEEWLNASVKDEKLIQSSIHKSVIIK